MPVTLLEKMMLTRLKYKNKHKVCAGLSELLAKTFSLPVFAIYAGNDSVHRLMGAYIDQEEFIKYNPMHHQARIKNDPDLLEGFNLPLILPVLSDEKNNQEIKLHSQLFGICIYPFEQWKIAVVFGGVDPGKRKKAATEIHSMISSLATILLPLLILEKGAQEEDSVYQEEISRRFIQSMMDLRGFVTLILRLLLIYFNAEYAGINLVYQKKHIFIELGDKQNKDFVREFDFLTISSSKNFFTTNQTHLVVKVVLFYLNQIIHRFFRPRINSLFYLEILKDLVRIYEALFQSISNELDMHLDMADYLAKKMDLSEKEHTLLHWLVGTMDIGKVALRVSSLSFDKIYEKEFHDTIRENILKNMAQLIENFDVLTSDFSLFQGIIKTCQFYFYYANHCSSNDMSELTIQLSQTKVPDNFRRMLMERIATLKNVNCYQFSSCPEPVREICSCSKSKKRCYQQESVFFAHFHKHCQECLYFQINKEKQS